MHNTYTLLLIHFLMLILLLKQGEISKQLGKGERFFKKYVSETKRGGERKHRSRRNDAIFLLSFFHYRLL